jgi:hypothetical protein
MRKPWLLLAAVLVASGAQAQDPPEAASGLEVGVRYWVGTGSTKRSHDASSASPIALNPTSTLTYDNLDANVLELNARKSFGEGAFVKGNIGLGKINTGTFTDQDFFISGGGPVRTQTVSAVDGKLHYATLDFGREVWRRGNSTFGVFAGYQLWSERVDGHGFSDSFGPRGLSDDVLAISNDLTWKSFRLGAEMRKQNGRTRFTAELALIPYATYRNEDSHYLRQSPSDLGPVPNVIATGKGYGGQLELEVRRSYPDYWGLDLGIGYRYWRLESTKGTQSQAGRSFAIVDLVSERQGVAFTVSKTW